ncbi:uncharacterized protein FA14DRAFT_70917 [Meira miltonrushii]|uniref:Uncharacterized protein n=1 Tax=Meira miltonrushii TaxID=1280837 RepID=A0A316VFM8_9BASI|nr:uncharacterized protein FA14DRAFT_70917 [Meira miltonrushii]PWN34285.1 hypothetical protein FA14DRAFT_70917 [Meira miltonrushii]
MGEVLTRLNAILSLYLNMQARRVGRLYGTFIKPTSNLILGSFASVLPSCSAYSFWPCHYILHTFLVLWATHIEIKALMQHSRASLMLCSVCVERERQV